MTLYIILCIYTYGFKDSFPSQLGSSCKVSTERWFLIKKAQTQIVERHCPTSVFFSNYSSR